MKNFISCLTLSFWKIEYFILEKIVLYFKLIYQFVHTNIIDKTNVKLFYVKYLFITKLFKLKRNELEKLIYGYIENKVFLKI